MMKMERATAVSSAFWLDFWIFLGMIRWFTCHLSKLTGNTELQLFGQSISKNTFPRIYNAFVTTLCQYHTIFHAFVFEIKKKQPLHSRFLPPNLTIPHPAARGGNRLKVWFLHKPPDMVEGALKAPGSFFRQTKCNGATKKRPHESQEVVTNLRP